MRLVLAEDSVLLREGLIRLLVEAGHEVLAAVGDAPNLISAVEMLSAAAGTRPDVVITDVRMPPDFTDDGLRAAVTLRRRFPGLGVLVLSQYVEEVYARELLANGAQGVGYLLKDRIQDLDGLDDALARIHSGSSVIDPEVVSQIMSRRRPNDQLNRLTPREQEVLALMAQGCTNRAIAAKLVITEGAVEKHVAAVFAKLDLAASPDENRRVLAVLAYFQH
ncbi:MAG: response regulator transcription factor [Propionibacteriaceae bacterium]|jgi:DNA-binding NarL/FixJ family response regulator|nr:response regulator transcription factor [Propionibacteriaceae bacterium]